MTLKQANKARWILAKVHRQPRLLLRNGKATNILNLIDVLLQYYCTLSGEDCPAHKPDFETHSSDNVCIPKKPAVEAFVGFEFTDPIIGGIIGAGVALVIVGMYCQEIEYGLDIL